MFQLPHNSTSAENSTAGLHHKRILAGNTDPVAHFGRCHVSIFLFVCWSNTEQQYVYSHEMTFRFHEDNFERHRLPHGRKHYSLRRKSLVYLIGTESIRKPLLIWFDHQRIHAEGSVEKAEETKDVKMNHFIPFWLFVCLFGPLLAWVIFLLTTLRAEWPVRNPPNFVPENACNIGVCNQSVAMEVPRRDSAADKPHSGCSKSASECTMQR